MKSFVLVLAVAALPLVLLTAPAAAQQGPPVTRSQVHESPDWGWWYAGASAMWGNWLGTRFSDNTGDYSQSITGANLVLGTGSSIDYIGTEFNLQIIQEAFETPPDPITGQVRKFDQLIAKLGASVLVEFMQNEVINADGGYTREGLGITGIFGFSVFFFPDDEFRGTEFNLAVPEEVSDERLWAEIGIVAEYPLDDLLSLMAYANLEFDLYSMERLLDAWPFDRIFLDPDFDQINADYFIGDWQGTIGGMFIITPTFDYSSVLWRFFIDVNFVMTTARDTNPLPSILMVTGGVTASW